jgi:exodeoxyribonuclease-5
MITRVNLTQEQTAALAAVEEFVTLPSWALTKRSFTLHGLAGTGKTTLMAVLARRYPRATLCAFTGKAASVLRRKVGLKVSTIHSVLFNFKGLVADDFEEGKMNPIFEDKGVELPDQVVLVDEGSMVGRSLAVKLLDTQARLVVCGDPGQLPPVKDAQFFLDPDVTLQTIHRQALDSPIIRQAHRIRHEGTYDEDGDFRVIARAEPEDLLAADAILCWRNITRQRLNARKRELLGLTGPLRAGEPVMCLKNDHRLGLYNGAVYELAYGTSDEPEDGVTLITDEYGSTVRVHSATIEGQDPAFDKNRYDDDYLPFAPAYAATVHKSQGSEYPNVLLFDECSGVDWAQFMYTGVTRAAERCTVVRWR